MLALIQSATLTLSAPRPPHAGPPHTSHCTSCDCKYRKGRVVMGSDSRKLPTNCCIFTVDSSHGILDQCIYSDNLINSTVREILLWEKPIFGVAEDNWKTTSLPRKMLCFTSAVTSPCCCGPCQVCIISYSRVDI